MQHDLKFALIITVTVFAVILGFAVTAVMTA
ncbi:YnhF family membrane protein [Vibrio sinaloensis]|nr:YnhF family membrane protein [Vibrio sinaloensis]MCZ4293741.1 YnhF family membrane protein [Vibrio sinaloensis]